MAREDAALSARAEASSSSSSSSRGGGGRSGGGGGGSMAAIRARLPIASFRDAIVDLVGANQVVLLSGETGCGKTTQVRTRLRYEDWRRKSADILRSVCGVV